MTEFLDTIIDLLNTIIPVLMGLGMVYFIWGVLKYVIADGEEAKKKGRDQIIYGIIGLVVISSIWGLVELVMTTFDLGSQSARDVSNLITQPPDASACTSPSDGSNLADILNYITCTIGKSVIPFIFAIAMVSFIWGAVKFFIINADEEAKRKEGKQFMIWGIIALAVMISVWGLVSIVGGTFGVDTGILPTVAP